MSKLQGPEMAPASGQVERLVILLHGLGADGRDLLGLAPELADDLPDTQFCSPNAPFPCDMAPYGYQWFSLRDRDPVRILTEMSIAMPMLNDYIDAQAARFGLDDSQVALIGFSQGAMMSMFTSIRRVKPLAGIVAMSGILRSQEAMVADVKSRPPICVIHGTDDEVVPFAALAITEEALKSANIPAESHARPGLGHGIDMACIEITKKFLTRCFKL